MYRKIQVHLKAYKPKKNIQHPEFCKVDNNQSVAINQRPKHAIKASNRLNL